MTGLLRHVRPVAGRMVAVAGLAVGLLWLELRNGATSGPAVCRPPVVDVTAYDDEAWT